MKDYNEYSSEEEEEVEEEVEAEVEEEVVPAPVAGETRRLPSGMMTNK